MILAILSAINAFLPQGSFLPVQELPASRPVLALSSGLIILVVYGGLGYVGLRLSRVLGFAEIWDPTVTERQRFLIPALTGIGIGIFFIPADILFSHFHTLGPLPHPPFPASLVASAAAGIGEELIFRLFFISSWVWVIAHLIFRKKWQNRVFWIIAILSALVFAVGHLPAVMVMYGWQSFDEIPPVLWAEVISLNGLLALIAAAYLRKFGFLAAVGVHFWTDVVWHVIWGAL